MNLHLFRNFIVLSVSDMPRMEYRILFGIQSPSVVTLLYPWKTALDASFRLTKDAIYLLRL